VLGEQLYGANEGSGHFGEGDEVTQNHALAPAPAWFVSNGSENNERRDHLGQVG
jgi:hypothetical protein